MNLRPTILLPLIGVLFACLPPESSDLKQYDLRIGLVDQLGLDSHRVLVGTTFSLDVEAVTDGDELDASCVTSSTTGVVSKVGEEFSVDAAGPGTIELAPNDACQEVAELGPDRWSAIGVEPGDATALWVGAGDSLVLDRNMSPGPAGMFPEPIGRPLDHARVVADGHFLLLPTLVDQSAGERAEIRWRDEDGILAVPDEYNLLTTQVFENMIEFVNFLDGKLRVGESFTSSITILGNQFELPEVEAVPLQQIVELELAPVYWPGREPDREWGPPFGIVAIAVDGEGHRVFAAPIEWSVAGGDVYTTKGDAYPALFFGDHTVDDMVAIEDCGKRPTDPEWRNATVDAMVAGHVASVELEWLALPSDYDELDPDDPRCRDLADDGRGDSGCSCSATAAPRDAALAALSLLVLAAVRRRRRPLMESTKTGTLTCDL
jgi:MYXO-CTERM domain-containing protein